MVKVKTFTTTIKIFETKSELDKLDEAVNRFLADSKIKKVISVSDASTTGDNGMTIGIVRVITYEE